MKPLGHKILALPIKEDTTKTGIIIPESGKKNNKGEVIFLGTKVDYINIGDKVIYHEHSGTNLEYNDKDHIILKCGPIDSEVIAIL